MMKKVKTIQFMNNVLVYRRLEIHELPAKEADVFLKARLAVEVPSLDEPSIKDVTPVESDEATTEGDE